MNENIDLLGDLAEAIRGDNDANAPQRTISRRMGVVAVVNYATNTVDVALGASGVTVTNITFLQTFQPYVGQTVWVDLNGNDPLVIGSPNTGARYGGSWSRVAVQSIPNATLTTLLFDTEAYDVANLLTPTSGIATIPTGGLGQYIMHAGVSFVSAVGANRSFIEIVTNGLTTDGTPRAPIEQGGHGTTTGIGDFVATTNIRVNVFQSSGGAINCTGMLRLHRIGG